MPLRDAAAEAPQSQSADRHKLIELFCQRYTAEAVKGIGVGSVYLVKILRGTIPCSRHSMYLLAHFEYIIKPSATVFAIEQ